ncbi:MAG: ubiquinone biosynthesis regulatory protein kinase UbiB [Acidiferrobacteraceae bacterium]|nr:ubiquinone biosynthesis regulatory protein kinase UbiB [Acidiferrobacteraceae bacterium]
MISIVRRASRFYRIVRVFFRYDLGEFIAIPYWYQLARFFFCPLLFFKGAGKNRPRGERLRSALEELGPVFVKFGQMLSTRPDLIPDDIVEQLTRLQDDVSPFTGEVARALIQESYEGRLEDHFAQFEDKPIASASVAQVHRAQLHNGRNVVVKVLRPDVEKLIDQDIELLYLFANVAKKYWSDGKRLRPVEVVDEYNKTIHNELDLMYEASNASKLRSNFPESRMIYVPKIYWEHTRKNVMVMEEVTGISIRDIEAIKRAGIDLRTLAHNGVEIFFTQAFRDGFFHADMHPGNIFVGQDGQYRAVDFGIMGSLSDQDKRYLAENFLAFFDRDYRGVAEAHIRAGWVPSDTRADEFEAAIRAVCEPIFAKPISEISFARLVVRLFQTARRFDMPIQPQLVLLQKTLFNIEGLGRQLYPDLDLWETAKPYLEEWMRSQVTPLGLLKRVRHELPKLAPIIPEISALGLALLRRSNDKEYPSQDYAEKLSWLNAEIRHQHRQLVGTIAACTVILAGIVLILGGISSVTHANFIETKILGIIFAILGIVLLILYRPRKKKGNKRRGAGRIS